MKPFTVITPTGDRPEAFAICTELMKKQTIKPVQWLVIDDGKEPMTMPDLPFVEYIHRARGKDEPSHTLPLQMRLALHRVQTDYVVMMEDDDWYRADYFQETVSRLQFSSLVGLVRNYYYFVRTAQYYQHQNLQHSSWCSTAFTREWFNYVYTMPINNPYLDMRLWSLARQNHFIRRSKTKPCLWYSETPIAIGVKQLPGRVGVTYDSNRRVLRRGMKEDKGGLWLKSKIGDDFAMYKPYIGTEPCSQV